MASGSQSLPITEGGKELIESPHDKTNSVAVRPAKTYISLGIRPVWSESSLSDQTGRKPRLIWVFAGCTCHFVGFLTRRLNCSIRVKALETFKSSYKHCILMKKCLNMTNSINTESQSQRNILEKKTRRVRQTQYMKHQVPIHWKIVIRCHSNLRRNTTL